VFAAIGRGVTRRPWLVILGWLAAAAVIILTAPSLSSITTSDQSAFLPSSAESVRAAVLAKQAFPDGGGTTAVIVAKRADSRALTAADSVMLAGLAQRLNAGRPSTVRGVAFDPTRNVAPDRRVALLAVQFTAAPERPDVQAAVAALRHTTADTLRGSGLTAGMTGQAAIVVDNKRAFTDAEKIVTVATVALIVVLLLLIFRSPVAALLPLLAVGLVFGVSTALVAAAGHAFGFTVGQELPTMLTVVLFGIGTDYLLFLLFRYRERRRAGDEPADAVVAAVERVGEAIASAAFAVIAAFGALVLATLGFFTTLGPALAIGVAVMLAAALTLVPAVVTVLGRWVFWPSRSALRAPRATRFAAVGRVVARRPGVVIVASVALLGALASGVLTFKPDFDPIGQLPGGTEATRAYQDLKTGFPAGALNPTDVYLRGSAPPAQVAAFVARLAKTPGVAAPLPPRVSADGRVVDVPLVLAVEPYGSRGLDLASGPLRDAARVAAPAGTTVLVGGQTMAFADIRAATNRDLGLIFPVAGALFVLILALLLRSVLAPLYLVGMVVLGFAATLGATTWLFQDGLGHAGLAFSIPIILYLFVTAIGTDYNILVTARLREEIREGHPPRRAAALAVEHAGPSVAAAAVILAGTFGALLLSGVPFFTEIGFAVTLGIVLVAFVVSVLLVPAVTALARHAAWWPGRRDRAPARHALTAHAARHPISPKV